MNIEARQDTDRLTHIYDTYIKPALAPIERLLHHLAEQGRTRPITLRAFHFLIAHGGAAPFTLVPLALHFDPDDPLHPDAVTEHAELVADFIIRGLKTRRRLDHSRRRVGSVLTSREKGALSA